MNFFHIINNFFIEYVFFLSSFMALHFDITTKHHFHIY